MSCRKLIVGILVSHTYTYLKPEEDKYVPNMTSNDNRMEIRRNWDLLMPRLSTISYRLFFKHFRSLTESVQTVGSGSILVPDYEEHPLLGDPIIDDPIRSGPIFEASWTHALHCVSLSYP
jgi:hypothetical protein